MLHSSFEFSLEVGQKKKRSIFSRSCLSKSCGRLPEDPMVPIRYDAVTVMLSSHHEEASKAVSKATSQRSDSHGERPIATIQDGSWSRDRTKGYMTQKVATVFQLLQQAPTRTNRNDGMFNSSYYRDLPLRNDHLAKIRSIGSSSIFDIISFCSPALFVGKIHCRSIESTSCRSAGV